MSTFEVGLTTSVDDCKSYIKETMNSFHSCHRVEDVIVRCEDLTCKELIAICNIHDVYVQDRKQVNLDKLKTRLVNHLCESYSLQNSNSTLPSCCQSDCHTQTELLENVMENMKTQTRTGKTFKRVLTAIGLDVGRVWSMTQLKAIASNYITNLKTNIPRTSRWRAQERRSHSDTNQVPELHRVKSAWPQRLSVLQKAKLVNKFR